MIKEKTIKICVCERCEHEWIPRNEGDPIKCPGCGSPYWNIPKKQKILIEHRKEVKE